MHGNELDLFLGEGYFRSQQQLFTCHYVFFNEQYFQVFWLRLVLGQVTYGPNQRRLLRINAQFSIRVVPFRLTDELEQLYARYRAAIDFDAPESVESCLLNGSRVNGFDTYVVEVRDGDQLIAAGIFDNGAESIAGIMNFYDPFYRKYSLGKFLMLQKIQYAINQKKTYYYPGYVVRHYPKFDYKLFACESATELLDIATWQWVPYSWHLVNG